MGLLSSLRDRFVDDEDAEHMRVAESPEGIAAAIARDYRQEPIPTDPHGYFYGPLAQGLALSAPMVVANDATWNSLTDVGDADVKYFMSQVWGITAPVHTRTVDMHIAKLRRKLGTQIEI